MNTIGFDEMLAEIDGTAWSEIHKHTGLSPEHLESIAKMYLEAKTRLFCWGMGIATQAWYGKYRNQEGFETLNGDELHDGVESGQAGFRMDLQPDTTSTLMVQGDICQLGEVLAASSAGRSGRCRRRRTRRSRGVSPPCRSCRARCRRGR